MAKYKIFNHSSEKMPELDDDSIDLAITDPPFNVGSTFGEKVDNEPHETYIQMIRNIISQTSRVLKPSGLALMLVPKKVQKDGETYEYPEIYSTLCKESGLILLNSFQYNIKEKDYTPSADNWDEIDPTKKHHSQEIVGLVFSKTKQKIKIFSPKTLYQYEERDGHPCPFPPRLVEDILNTYFNPNDTVLDSFMGTASLGVEVLRRGGTFFGYEIDKGFYKTAYKELERIG